MGKKTNALDWFTDEHCGCCDVPGEECSPGSPRQIACLLATLIRLLTTE